MSQSVPQVKRHQFELPHLDPYNVNHTRSFIQEHFNGNRLAHILTVAENVNRTLTKTPVLRHYADLGTAAALLHDVGYIPELHDTGFHPIDGARYLTSLGATELAAFIICHSQAAEYADLAGLPRIPVSLHPIASVITFWDVRVAPGGKVLSYEERLEDIKNRHGEESLTWKAHMRAMSRIQASEDRLRQIPSVTLD